MQNRSLNPGEVDDFKRVHDHLDRVNNLNKDAEETLGIYQEVVNETDRQNRVLDDIGNDAAEYEHELGMS